MSPPKPRRALGKGLATLFEESAPSEADAPAAEASTPERFGDPADDREAPVAPPRELPVDAMLPNPGQPRSRFDEKALGELANSIAESGVMQPVLVRPAADGIYEIVAGERRWRAAKDAGVERMPVVVRELDDEEALLFALIENLQRVDLNPVEEARGYAKLQESLGCTQEELARRVGKSRPHVANSMRLLKLPGEVLELVESGQLTASHVRPLVEHPQARTLALRMRREGLSVRQAELLAEEGGRRIRRRTGAARDPDLENLEGSLSAALGTSVRIATRGASGEIRVRYRDLDEFDRIVTLIARPR